MRTIVVLPTFNEQENVAGILAAVRVAVPDADVLVVDDNSPDGTASVVEEVAADLGQIKLLRRPGKQGLGSAYREGFSVALDEGYDTIVSMDADGSHEPTVLPDLLRLIEAGAGTVIGSRYVPGGATVDWPLHRRLLSRWGNRYTSFVLGLQVRDCTSGYRAYRRRVTAGHRAGDHDGRGLRLPDRTGAPPRATRGARDGDPDRVHRPALRAVEDVESDRRRVDDPRDAALGTARRRDDSGAAGRTASIGLTSRPAVDQRKRSPTLE